MTPVQLSKIEHIINTQGVLVSGLITDTHLELPIDSLNAIYDIADDPAIKQKIEALIIITPIPSPDPTIVTLYYLPLKYNILKITHKDS